MLWFIKTKLENDDGLFIQEESSVLDEELLTLMRERLFIKKYQIL